MQTQHMRGLAIVGCGELGSALIRGILTSGLYEPRYLHVYDNNTDKIREFGEVHACKSACEAVDSAKYVFLAVRPQDILHALRNVSLHNKVLVSMAAGIPVDWLQARLTDCDRVLRTMPNIALREGEAATAYAAPCNLTDDELADCLAVFRACGRVEPLDEAQMNAATALNGSGPAYFVYFIKNILDAAVDLGIPQNTALRLLLQTVRSSIALIESLPSTNPETLLRQIASPGGTTSAALDVMRARNVDNIIRDAIYAASDRAHQLSDEALSSAEEISEFPR